MIARFGNFGIVIALHARCLGEGCSVHHSQNDAIRHRAIFNTAFDFIIIASDPQGRITDGNVGAERILAGPVRKWWAAPVDRIFTPEDRLMARPAVEMQVALETGRATDERWHLKRDGSMFWASGQMSPLRDDNGATSGF